MKQSDTGPLVVLNLPRTNLVLVAFAKGIHQALTGNASFPNPTPTLAVFADHIDQLEQAEALAATRVKGAAKQRNAKKQKVIQDLRHIKDYVQSVIEGQATAVDAKAMAATAGLGTRAVVPPFKSLLSAANTGLSGVVELEAKAVARDATYFWQYSVDQSVWTDVPPLMQASTTVTGLTSAQTYYFRFRALTRKGMTEYSQIVGLLVH
jgi:hypothetical protein